MIINIKTFVFPRFNLLCTLKVVIIIDLGVKTKSAKMLKIQQLFPKLYRGFLYVVFHNLESQNAELVDFKKN